MSISKKIFNQSKRFVGLLALTFYSLTTLACDLHGAGGFGFGMYGPQQQKWHASPVDNAQKIKLRYPFVTKISTAEVSDISIEYELPIDVKNAKLDIKSSTNLALINDKSLELAQEGGVHAIQVEAEAKGQHVLTLNVSALQNNKPISMTKRIFINAQPANQG